MDRPEVPRYVVEYVMYHEMLHVKHPTRQVGMHACCRISPEFARKKSVSGI
jgi:predicted metal-dependent hydrolase